MIKYSLRENKEYYLPEFHIISNQIEEFCENIALINKGEIVLQGNLKEIKGEYGMNRLTISEVNLSYEELKEMFRRDLNEIAKILDEKRKYRVPVPLSANSWLRKGFICT